MDSYPRTTQLGSQQRKRYGTPYYLSIEGAPWFVCASYPRQSSSARPYT